MTSPIPVTAIIYTLNEAVHLPSCLSSLKDFSEVIVVDSYSSDATEKICADLGVKFYQHEFQGFGSQRNWSFDHVPMRNDWVLILDADERVTAELAQEIADKISTIDQETSAFQIKRRFYMWGRWLRYSNLYPTWVVRLVHKERVRYVNRGHAETQEVQGRISALENDLIDENLKGIHEWFDRQNRYSDKEAEYELKQQSNTFNWSELFSTDAMRRRVALKCISYRVPLRPFLYFVYSYLWRRGFLEGKDGLVFCLMKALYQRMIIIKKFDLKRQENR